MTSFNLLRMIHSVSPLKSSTRFLAHPRNSRRKLISSRNIAMLRRKMSQLKRPKLRRQTPKLLTSQLKRLPRKSQLRSQPILQLKLLRLKKLLQMLRLQLQPKKPRKRPLRQRPPLRLSRNNKPRKRLPSTVKSWLMASTISPTDLYLTRIRKLCTVPTFMPKFHRSNTMVISLVTLRPTRSRKIERK